MEIWLKPFKEVFATDQACYEFLYQLKWPEGFRCPQCNHNECYEIRSRRLPLLQCRLCGHQTTLTAGTVMDKSRTPLTKWLFAIYLLTNPAISGVNAVALSSVLEVTYKTAWTILYKVRQVIGRLEDQSPLDGSVKAIVAPYCRPLIGSLLPHPKERPVVIGGVLEPNHKKRMIKLKIPSMDWLRSTNANRMDERGEKWFTESYLNYSTGNIDFIREPIRFRDESRMLRSILGEAQAWAAKTFRGIGGKYLQSYLDEFCFRFNQVSRQNKPGAAMNHLAMACLRSG